MKLSCLRLADSVRDVRVFVLDLADIATEIVLSKDLRPLKLGDALFGPGGSCSGDAPVPRTLAPIAEVWPRGGHDRHLATGPVRLEESAAEGAVVGRGVVEYTSMTSLADYLLERWAPTTGNGLDTFIRDTRRHKEPRREDRFALVEMLERCERSRSHAEPVLSQVARNAETTDLWIHRSHIADVEIDDPRRPGKKLYFRANGGECLVWMRQRELSRAGLSVPRRDWLILGDRNDTVTYLRGSSVRSYPKLEALPQAARASFESQGVVVPDEPGLAARLHTMRPTFLLEVPEGPEPERSDALPPRLGGALIVSPWLVPEDDVFHAELPCFRGEQAWAVLQRTAGGIFEPLRAPSDAEAPGAGTVLAGVVPDGPLPGQSP